RPDQRARGRRRSRLRCLHGRDGVEDPQRLRAAADVCGDGVPRRAGLRADHHAALRRTRMTAVAPRVLVVVPTYNERDNIETLVEQILACGPSYGVLVVDDQSPDGTGAIIDGLAARHPGRVEAMHRTGKRGLGRSYVDALPVAITREVDVVCQMDADFSHDPAYLPRLVSALETGGFDLVIGSRYLHGVSVVNWPLRRLILSAFANRYVRFVTGLPARDCTSGYRCWR